MIFQVLLKFLSVQYQSQTADPIQYAEQHFYQYQVRSTANGDEVVASETEDGIQVTGLNDITVIYETADGTAETKADVKDGSTVNITVNDDENTVETDWDEKTETNCSCNCHGNAFMQFLHKIVSFLRKLFGMTQYQYCNCGKAHW